MSRDCPRPEAEVCDTFRPDPSVDNCLDCDHYENCHIWKKRAASILKQSNVEAGWTAKDCANYCTASFPHPSCKATGARCNLDKGAT